MKVPTPHFVDGLARALVCVCSEDQGELLQTLMWLGGKPRTGGDEPDDEGGDRCPRGAEEARLIAGARPHGPPHDPHIL